MATLYPHRSIFAAGAALDSPKITTSARVTPAGSAVTTAGFNPDLDTSSDFLVAINRRSYLRLTNTTAPDSENLTKVPISSLFIDPSPEASNPFPVAVFTGFSRILDVRVSQLETVFTVRIENYEAIVSFATKSTSTKASKTARYAAHVTPVPRERDDTVFLNEYQLRIPRWAYDQFRETFKGYEFSEIGIQVNLSNNSPFPTGFNLDDVKIEQGIATATQGVFRVTLLEYPHVVNLQVNNRAAVIRCRVQPGESFLSSSRYFNIPEGETPQPAQYYDVFVSKKEYEAALVILQTFLTHGSTAIRTRDITVVPVAEYAIGAAFDAGPFGSSINSGQSDIDEIDFDLFEYRLVVYMPKANISSTL